MGRMHPDQSISLSTMAAAFAVDTILSALLIFLWLMQRKEKHALFWGVGQLSVMSGLMTWFIGEHIFLPQIRLFLCALLLTGGIIGFWSGTQYFLGDLRRRQLPTILAASVAMTGVFYLLWNAYYSLVPPGSASALGVVMFWMGARLIRAQRRYPWLRLSMVRP